MFSKAEERLEKTHDTCSFIRICIRILSVFVFVLQVLLSQFMNANVDA